MRLKSSGMGKETHMTQVRKLVRGTGFAAVAGLCAFAFAAIGSPSIASAKKAKAAASQSGSQGGDDSKLSPEEQKKKASRQAYDAGLKDFANGRYQPAIEQLSNALTTGGLSSPEMAKALYTRGVAYRKQKQPGQAISDLTSALWLKNGLSAADRNTATAERAEAYKMAGIQDTGKGPERVVGTPITASTTPAAPAATPASGPNAGSAGLSAAAIAQAAANNGSGDASGGPVSRQDPSSSAAQDAARARAAYAPVNSLASSSVTSSPAPAPQTTASAPAQSGSFGSGVTGFFSNMFGGSSAAPAEAQAPSGVTTASTGAVAETSSWTNATVVNEGGAAKSGGKSQKVAAVSPKPAVATKGKYKIHIAAVRSRAEADALAQQLVAQHGADLANHVPTVDEAVIGSMGTFYRVRINGYASQEEPRGLCDKLRSSGLDCLVVTN
ncbi:Sporulation domain protein [Hyphomicrobium denitrificans ATCC 51888]|uniref:Sporulation domain protein n=2 Tax=Hyphomicrobium denitrificans TaxID=53399 RepID=D8JYK5_HYPDA|nr:Sporulation domain protein [Hyphomicrobium denitrificans ATCC 51888]